MSEDERRARAEGSPVTVHAAFSALHDLLVDEDADFDAAEGLVDLKTRIDRHSATPTGSGESAAPAAGQSGVQQEGPLS